MRLDRRPSGAAQLGRWVRTLARAQAGAARERGAGEQAGAHRLGGNDTRGGLPPRRPGSRGAGHGVTHFGAAATGPAPG
jgi:hypothetical protein